MNLQVQHLLISLSFPGLFGSFISYQHLACTNTTFMSRNQKGVAVHKADVKPSGNWDTVHQRAWRKTFQKSKQNQEWQSAHQCVLYALWLDLMTLKVFSNLHDSRILQFRCFTSEQCQKHSSSFLRKRTGQL